MIIFCTHLPNSNVALHILELLLDAFQFVDGRVGDNEGSVRLFVVMVELLGKGGEEHLSEGLRAGDSCQVIPYIPHAGVVGLVAAVVQRVGQVVAQPAARLSPVWSSSGQSGGGDDLEPQLGPLVARILAQDHAGPPEVEDSVQFGLRLSSGERRLWPLDALAVVPHLLGVPEAVGQLLDIAAQLVGLVGPHDRNGRLHLLEVPPHNPSAHLLLQQGHDVRDHLVPLLLQGKQGARRADEDLRVAVLHILRKALLLN